MEANSADSGDTTPDEKKRKAFIKCQMLKMLIENGALTFRREGYNKKNALGPLNERIIHQGNAKSGDIKTTHSMPWRSAHQPINVDAGKKFFNCERFRLGRSTDITRSGKQHPKRRGRLFLGPLPKRVEGAI